MITVITIYVLMALMIIVLLCWLVFTRPDGGYTKPRKLDKVNQRRVKRLEHICKMEEELFGIPTYEPIPMSWDKCPAGECINYVARDKGIIRYFCCLVCGKRSDDWLGYGNYYHNVDRQWLNEGVWEDHDLYRND